MTSPGMGALLLAGAVLMTPGPARHRLPGLSVGRGRRRRLATIIAVPFVAGTAVCAPPALLAAGLIGGTVFTGWRRRRRAEHRRRAEGRAMASALELLIGEMRAGSHPVRAFSVAAAESPGLVGVGLHRVAARVHLGADVVAGLLAVEEYSAVPAYWRRLAVFWELADQRGLPLSVLMQAAHRDIVERQRFTDRIRAALAGARATAVILAALPALGVALGQLIGAHPVRFLLGGGLGGALLAGGVGLIAAGLFWADRIIERLVA